MLTIVLVMWSLNLGLWVIDVRNIIVELRTSFIESSQDNLDVRYGNSFSKQLPLYLVEDILFSYMVRYRHMACGTADKHFDPL